MLAVQALRKMLEVARVADAKDEARVRESKLRMNSPKKMKLDDRVDTQPKKTETEEPKSDGRWNNIRWTYNLRRKDQKNWNEMVDRNH